MSEEAAQPAAGPGSGEPGPGRARTGGRAEAAGAQRGSALRLVVRVLLIAVAGAALAWVVAPIVTSWDQVRAMAGRPSLMVALVGGSVAYGALLWLCMAPGWWWLTRLYGRTTRPLPAAAVWCRTQIVKYLPGNVAHYVGRQVLGRRLGLHHAEMAAASLLELVSILAAAGVIGVTGLLLGAWTGPAGDSGAGSASAEERLWTAIPVLAGLIVAGLLSWPVADAALRRMPIARERMAGLPRLSAVRSVTLLGPTIVVHAAFLIATGSLLWWLAAAAAPEGVPAPSFVRLVWVYAVAWAIGTVAPGAPAGAGVREAILTFELAQDLGRPEAAAIALGLRLVTTAGDGLAFAASLLVPIQAAGRNGSGAA